jgi:hypothetical protein
MKALSAPPKHAVPLVLEYLLETQPDWWSQGQSGALRSRREYRLSKIIPVEYQLPKTLGQLLDDFFSEHAERKLASKTIER